MSLNLQSAESVAANSSVIFGIVDPTSINVTTGKDELLLPETGSLVKGDGILLEIDEGRNGRETKKTTKAIIEYGGFINSASLVSTGTSVPAGTHNITLTVTKDTKEEEVDISITTTGATTNLQAMELLRDQINQTTGDSAVRARIGFNATNTSATLYISPQDSHQGLKIDADTTILGSTALNISDEVAEFKVVKNSNVQGRFSNFHSLHQAFDKLGFENSNVLENISNSNVTAIGATLILDTSGVNGGKDKAVSLSNYSKDGSSDILSLFNLEAGYQEPLYNPYDSDNNMAGGKVDAAYSRDITIFDSQGSKHSLNVAFLKLGVNKWAYELYADEPTEVQNRSDGLLQAGILNFDSTGNLLSTTASTQVSDSRAITAPDEQLNFTPVGPNPTLSIEVGTAAVSETYTYTFHKKIMELGDGAGFTGTSTSLNAAGNLMITVGGNTYNFTKAATTNDLQALNSLSGMINANAELESTVVLSGGNYHLAIKAKDPEAALSVTGGTIQTPIGHILADNVPANSFRSYAELVDLINLSNGTQKLDAKLVRESGGYVVRVEPEVPGHTLTFTGLNTLTAPSPFGDGITPITLDTALDFADTTDGNQIPGPTDDVTIDWSVNIGADQNDISINFNGQGDIGGMTQNDSEYSARLLIQDGVETGTIRGVTVDERGRMIAKFSNGRSKAVYQLPIGTVSNPNKLLSIGKGLYSVQEEESGQLNLKQSGLDGAGEVASGTLEGSNVELAEQMTNLLLAERGYQANARVVNVADRTNEELINLIR